MATRACLPSCIRRVRMTHRTLRRTVVHLLFELFVVALEPEAVRLASDDVLEQCEQKRRMFGLFVHWVKATAGDLAWRLGIVGHFAPVEALSFPSKIDRGE